MQNVAVIGAGSWGTTVARHMVRQGHTVRLWSHNPEVCELINSRHQNPLYLKDLLLPETLACSTDLQWCFEGAQAVLFVVPSSFLRSVVHDCRGLVPAQARICILTKGIEYETGYLMSEVVREELGDEFAIGYLSGPNHAEEISRDLPCAAVAASSDKACALYFKDLFNADLFRTYVSFDEIGVEVCAATKNVVSVACGIVKGYDYGDNTLAVIITRGLAEMSRIVLARGGNPLTCMGLAGMGDLIATCTSPHSRNQSFGLAFARGEALEDYEKRTHMIVEGARACRSVRRMAHALDVEVPITDCVYALLYEHASLDDVVSVLFKRQPGHEFSV